MSCRDVVAGIAQTEPYNMILTAYVALESVNLDTLQNSHLKFLQNYVREMAVI